MPPFNKLTDNSSARRCGAVQGVRQGASAMGYSTISYDDVVKLGWPTEALPLWATDVAYYGGLPVNAHQFYDDIFYGQLEPHREPGDYRTGEYGGIAVEVIPQPDGSTKGHRITFTQDGELYDLIDASENFILTSPITYAGYKRTAENARMLCAMAIELDDIVPDSGIHELFYSWERENAPLPRPTYVVCSGNGVHLYLAFDRPIRLFKHNYEKLTKIKYNLTRRYWTKYVCTMEHKRKTGRLTGTDEDAIQYEPLVQGFRAVGSRTKSGAICLAFRTGPKISVQYLNQFFTRPEFILDEHEVYGYPKGKTPIAEAKEKWPDWYQKRVVEHQPRDHYHRNRGLYDWWLKKILTPDMVTVGHRYYCLENLCALGVQCDIPKKEMYADARRVAAYMDSLTTDPKNPFTKSDYRSALKTYRAHGDSAFMRRVEYVSFKTGIPIERAKRNGRPQEIHLELARGIKKLKMSIGEDVAGGRPTAQTKVQDWRREHPDGRKVDCIRDTGLSKPTVLKWWDAVV